MSSSSHPDPLIRWYYNAFLPSLAAQRERSLVVARDLSRSDHPDPLVRWYSGVFLPWLDARMDRSLLTRDLLRDKVIASGLAAMAVVLFFLLR